MKKTTHGAVTLLLLLISSCSNQITPKKPDNSAQVVGCYAPGMSASSQDQCGIVSTFGDPTVDQTFSQEITIQSSFWNNIPASPLPWNDCKAPNAESLPGGNILFGVNFFQLLITQNNGDSLPIAGVLAHEWAHQIQFDNGWMVQTEPTVRSTELEADAFSGFYMALAKGWAWAYINDYFTTLASIGDYDFTNPSHHGTPQERVAAANLGFTTGLNAMQTAQPLSYAQLHQIFSSSIQSFSTGELLDSVPGDERVSSVLNAIRQSEMRAILEGKTHGINVVPPNVQNREHLYPHP
jgi:hypothetical protein